MSAFEECADTMTEYCKSPSYSGQRVRVACLWVSASQLLRKVAVAIEWDVGWVPKKGARPCPRRKSAQNVRLARQAQNSSIHLRKCAVTGWRVQRPKSNSAS